MVSPFRHVRLPLAYFLLPTDRLKFMDAVSNIFSLLKVDVRHPARLEAGGIWAFKFPASSHIRFGASVRGACWLSVDGESTPIYLQQGDGYLLTRGQSYAVGSTPDLMPLDGVQLFRNRDGPITYGTGRDAALVSGRFTFDELSSDLLLQVLPAVVHLRSGQQFDQVLQAAIARLDYESGHCLAGASIVTHHVAQIMLVQSVRMVAATPGHAPMGWLAAIADPRIGVALGLMHERLEERWTLNVLAWAAGMSRSTFSLRFKQLTGSAPLDYLLQLRMRKACRALRASQANVSSIAFDIGYRSESAFSSAFKRVVGEPPSKYRLEGYISMSS